MKNLIIILISLFSLSLYAQHRDTFTICNNVKIYTEYRVEENSLTVKSSLNFLDDVDLNNVEGVLHAISISMYKQHLILDADFIPSILTERLLDTLSIHWCNKLFERTLTGLKQDTIYDYGTHTPKEINNLKEAGYVVIDRADYSITNSFKFLSPAYDTIAYDTIDIYGLAIYLSDEDFENGVDFKLVPTIKTVVKCRNCFKGYMYAKVNDFILALNQDVIKVEQLNLEKSHWWNGIFYEGWQELDLTKYKEFIFIEKPK